jgi:nodulation protein E
MPRVLITGLGCVCALGEDADRTWEAMTRGVCGIGPLTLVSPEGLRHPIAGEARGYVPEACFDRHELSRLDRFAQFGVLAGREAVADAGLTFNGGLGLRSAIVLGSSIGGVQTLEDGYQRMYQRGGRHAPPLTVPRVMPNAAVSALSMELGIFGPGYAVSSACSSSNHAIAQAFFLVRSGQVDVAITGGSEAPLTYGHIRSWEALRVLAPDTCRPFCVERIGLVLAEGAGVLILESEDYARSRGAHVYAELAGAGMSSDASDLLLPDARGAERAMAAALADGGLNIDEIDYVNAHGTGTPANDVNETRAIRLIFGGHADRLAISSTKSMHGHALGASGGIEAIAAIRAIAESIVPPTVNYGSPDPQCDLDYVANEARQQLVRAALSNSFAFGGLNAGIAFRRFNG